MTYVANASNFRRALLNDFGDPNWEWKEVRQNEDVCLTYRGYIKFLETDLENVYPQGPQRSKSKYKRGIEYIAKQMLARGHVSSRISRHTLFVRCPNGSDIGSRALRHSQLQCSKSMRITYACRSTLPQAPQSFRSAYCPQNPSSPHHGIAPLPSSLTGLCCQECEPTLNATTDSS